MEQLEKRKEPRFHLQMPLEIYRQSKPSGKMISGTTNNISMNGFKAQSAVKLAKGERVVCNFDISDQGFKSRSEGVVKWNTSNGKHYIGVELSDGVKIASPLASLFETYLRKQLPASQPKKSLSQGRELYPHRLHSEIYWGLLFKIFNKPLLSEFISLSSEIGLRKFHLEQVQNLLESRIDDGAISGKIHDTQKTLDKSARALNNTIGLFQQLSADSRPDQREELPQAVNLKELCTERISGFYDKVKTIMPEGMADIDFTGTKVSPVLGVRSQMAEGLDLLLMYCYQFILFFRAKKINVKISSTNNQIRLDFQNDGSTIFRADSIEIKYDNYPSLENFSTREQKQLSILGYALESFKSINASMVLANQSGNNLLTLLIPV